MRQTTPDAHTSSATYCMCHLMSSNAQTVRTLWLQLALTPLLSQVRSQADQVGVKRFEDP